MIYAIVHIKGGVSKTTNAVHLATESAKRGPTLLIDGDPQASAASWAAWRREAGHHPSPTTTVLRGKAIFDEGKVLSKGFLNTIIDAGGRDSAGLRSALLLADLAIVPVGASSFDAATMTDLQEIIEMAKDFNTNLKVKILMSRIDPRTRNTETAEMISFLKEEGLEILEAVVCERVGFRRAIKEGATVEELGKDKSAIAEMRALYEEVL
ncbi:MAG TPA: ParA family protein [Pseudomonas xinjiangensis]|uniref:ParA family protein n=2 Tax=root TaxID=1 RepID=A0A7V1BS51_9GAMM|nr:ParA family protein [Halopseudomonas xinjiangensis]HEC46552.1 ParA family protein [Halopseudomonas xinjiangensis]